MKCNATGKGELCTYSYKNPSLCYRLDIPHTPLITISLFRFSYHNTYYLLRLLRFEDSKYVEVNIHQIDKYN